jgi:ribose/xylose/arabinose/galactoside ABC-type transport system permease subunit
MKKKEGEMIRKVLTYANLSTFLALVTIITFFGLFSPSHTFIGLRNLHILMIKAAQFGIVGLGIGLLMISGEFDLSVGSILLFSSLVFLKMYQAGLDLFISGLIAACTGMFVGLINALITVKGRIPSFIATLGTMMFWRGFTYLFSPGTERGIDPSVSPLFSSIMTGQIGIFPVQVFWFLAFALILGLILHFHKFGNWVFVTGDNKVAARAMGIKTDNVKTICFVIVGLLCAVSGIMQDIRATAFFVPIGENWNFMTIAASVVGGVYLLGGRGSMTGIVFGILIISVIENGLVNMRISYFWSLIAYGLVIILPVLLISKR